MDNRMNNQMREDLKVNGDDTRNGGSYNEIKVNGSLNLNGDTDCISMKVNGNLNIHGNSLAQQDVKINGKFLSEGNSYMGETKVSGRGDFKKNLEGKSLNVNGSVDVGENLEVNDISINGHTKVKGNVNAYKVDLKGYLNVDKDCNAEVFVAKGVFQIGGMLNADSINIELYEYNSKVTEIGGEVISIKKGESSIFFGLRNIINSIIRNDNAKYLLKTNTIEGDHIYIEYTKADVVRGKNVSIGPECEIERVECTGEYKRHESSIVKSSNVQSESSTALVKDDIF